MPRGAAYAVDNLPQGPGSLKREEIMERKKASDFDQRLLDLYDAYAHGRVSRREFLDRAGAFTAVGVSAAAVLQMLSPNYAWAQQVDPKDASLKN